jgi:hypothetical protein
LSSKLNLKSHQWCQQMKMKIRLSTYIFYWIPILWLTESRPANYYLCQSGLSVLEHIKLNVCLKKNVAIYNTDLSVKSTGKHETWRVLSYGNKHEQSSRELKLETYWYISVAKKQIWSYSYHIHAHLWHVALHCSHIFFFGNRFFYAWYCAAWQWLYQNMLKYGEKGHYFLLQVVISASLIYTSSQFPRYFSSVGSGCPVKTHQK